MHTSPEAFGLIDEMVNSVSGLSSKDEFYLRESILVLDKFLQIREEWKRSNKINQTDFFHAEQLAKKYLRFMEQVQNIDVFDNSFIYKYISEINQNVGNEKPIDEGASDTVKFLMKKLKISKLKADKIVQKAAEKGIDILKLQTQWSGIAPSLVAIVSEYDPQEN